MDVLIKNVRIPANEPLLIKVFADGSARCYEENGSSYSTSVREVDAEENEDG